MKNKACFLMPYFGKLPNYFNLFIESCVINHCVDFILLTDSMHTTVNDLSSNVKLIKLTMDDFYTRASNVLHTTIQIKDKHKVCDYRPFFGLMFEDILQGYEFWGHCDIDVVWGDLSRIFNDNFLKNIDVFSANDRLFAGHFTILRNIEKVNKLCFKINSYKTLINELQSTFMDEWGLQEVLLNEKDINLVQPKSLETELEKDFVMREITYKMDAQIADLKNSRSTLTYWNNGHAYYFYNEKFVEVLYIHFMGLKKPFFWEKFNQNYNYNEFYFSKIGFSSTKINENGFIETIKWIKIYFRLSFRKNIGKLVAKLFGKDFKRKLVLISKRK